MRNSFFLFPHNGPTVSHKMKCCSISYPTQSNWCFIVTSIIYLNQFPAKALFAFPLAILIELLH